MDGPTATGADGPAADIIAAHYDGRSATRHQVRLLPAADGFRLEGEGVDPGPFGWSRLVALTGTGGRSVYGLSGTQGWRLIFDGPPPPAFAAHLPLPSRYGRWIDRLGLPRAIVLFVLLAAGTVLAVLQAPVWIAPFIPGSWEDRLGDTMIGDFGGRYCRTPAGTAALRDLAGRLGAQTAGVRSVEVVRIPLVNAVALPGRRILVFDGLLAQARSPDELAGVLAHEIGHVRHRDTMAALLRQMGLSVLLSGANGNVGGALNTLLAISYTRKAESAADAYAIDALRRAAIAPDAIAAFFDRMGGGRAGEKMERAMSWVSSHPVSAERRAAFTRSRAAGRTYRPALDAAQWGALQRMCSDSPDTEPKETTFRW